MQPVSTASPLAKTRLAAATSQRRNHSRREGEQDDREGSPGIFPLEPGLSPFFGVVIDTWATYA